MKKIGSLLLAFALLCTGTLVACKQRVRNDGQTLEIFVSDFGYGTEWLDDIIELFQAEPWVQAKYPDLNIPAPSSNSERSYPVDRVLSGSVNTIDLLFGAATINNSLDKEYTDSTPYFDNLDGLYATKIPGEDVTLEEKLDDNFRKMSTFTDKNGDTGYYTVPWVTGMQGLLYNKTQFDALGLSVPLTTDQLRDETCPAIKAAGKTPFVFSTPSGYWTCTVFLIWWAQYEGALNYSNYYQAYVPSDVAGEYIQSSDVVRQTGRLRSLQVIEELISSHNTGERNFVHDNVNVLDFGQAQARFLTGQGLMMPNGDWFETEMRETASEGVTDEFTFMKTPVLSAVIENCPDRSIADDAELRALIRAIDAGKTELRGEGYDVTQRDYDKVREARRLILPVGNHVAYIPTYATAKEVAKDFLLFLATDKANNAYIRATYGASMPFGYDVKTQDPELYASLASMHKERLAMAETGIYMMNENTYKMAYFGGMYRLNSVTMCETGFTAKNAAEYLSAQELFQQEIDYWTPQRWQNALVNAGYAN